MTTRKRKGPTKSRKSKSTKAKGAKAQTGTKQEKLIGMLRRPEGATIEQMAKALQWQTHTVRGTLAGALKKKLGLVITSDKTEHGRVYRIA